MAAKLRPISLAKFLDVIQLLEGAFIRFPDGSFTIWAYKGSGYIPGTKGPQVTIADRPDDELFTVKEMESALNQLGYSISVFIGYADQCKDRPPGMPNQIQKDQEPKS